MRYKLKSERKFDAGMEPSSICYCSDGGGSAPPDYTPMAQASEEAARIMAAQSDRVLDESRRQYDLNMEVARPIIEAQSEIAQETARQGKDYYEYMVSQQRPVEEALNKDAMAAGSETAQQEAVDKAVADSQGGFTRAMNQVIRQGKRYGMAPIAATGTMAVQQAQGTAAAAGAAREKEKTLGYAKKMDVAGLYRGLPGASQGAYQVATSAGNSAVGNQMAPSGQLMNGSIAAAGLVGQGQQMKIQGLGNILSSQTNMAMNSNNNDDGIGGVIGAAGAIASMGGKGGFGWWSSKKLKTDKTPVDAEVITKGLQKIPVEAWRYKEGAGDEGEHIGPYAEDVHREFGDTAAPGGKMVDPITLTGLAIASAKDSADRLDRIEKKLGMTRR